MEGTYHQSIAYLHENGLVWGDAHTYNIMIDSSTKEPVLIDIEGGYNSDAKESDIQALRRIIAFIDDIKVIE